jgi:hypothetical protein
VYFHEMHEFSELRGPPRLCDGLITRPRKKPLITKEKEEKMGQINTMKTNSKRRKATWLTRLTIGHLKCAIPVQTILTSLIESKKRSTPFQIVFVY